MKVPVVACFVLLATTVLAHDYYRSKIPNGFSVPDMCGGRTWSAIGHYNPTHHTHDINAFGVDFARAGHKWTVTLCETDSDKDNSTNGEELGDPACEWEEGGQATHPATGHPGFCDNGATCGTQFYTCGCHGHNCAVGK